jgi:phosphate transport system permease protein
MATAPSALWAPRHRRRKITGAIFGVVCFGATLTGILVLAVLLGAVFVRTLAAEPNPPWYHIGAQLAELRGVLGALATQLSSTKLPEPGGLPVAGFKAGIAGTLWLLGLVTIIAIPVGIAAAVFLEEYMPAGRLKSAVQTNISNLAGVPSIVYGILGLALFVRAFGFESLALGRSLWAGALTLSLLVLPVVVIATQEALRAVPPSLRQGALALGATRWQVIRDHVLPGAMPGILTGTILALSRAIGETAPLLMVGAAASIRWTPAGPSDSYTALPVEIFNYARRPQPEFQVVASGGILILLGLLLSMNSIAIFLRIRHGRRS